jgi:hypothetical protein
MTHSDLCSCCARIVFASTFDLGELGKSAGMAGTGGGQLEGLNGEGEVLVVGIVHQEPKKGKYFRIFTGTNDC